MITELLEKIQKQGNSNNNYLSCQSKILFQNIEQLEKEAGSVFTDAFIPFAFPEGHFLIKEGEISKRLWLLETGLARRFYVTPEKELTLNFFQPGEFIDNYFSSTFNTPSDVNIVLTQPSTGLYIEWETIECLKKTYPQIADLEKKIIACDMRNKELHVRCYLGFDAKEYYRYLFEKHRILISFAKLNNIASFMGINRETLSRVRKYYARIGLK